MGILFRFYGGKLPNFTDLLLLEEGELLFKILLSCAEFMVTFVNKTRMPINKKNTSL